MLFRTCWYCASSDSRMPANSSAVIPITSCACSTQHRPSEQANSRELHHFRVPPFALHRVVALPCCLTSSAMFPGSCTALAITLGTVPAHCGTRRLPAAPPHPAVGGEGLLCLSSALEVRVPAMTPGAQPLGLPFLLTLIAPGNSLMLMSSCHRWRHDDEVNNWVPFASSLPTL